MITKEQIASLSHQYKINQSIVVREYVQIIFLKELYEENFSKNIFFKGGTAIRLIYGGQRFSEGLDFSTNLSRAEFSKQIGRFFQKLQNQYPFIIRQKRSLSGQTFLLTAKFPFMNNNIFVKLDFSDRESVIQPTMAILNTDYPVIIRSFINVLSKDEILAEKIRATIKRTKHRDLYDLWILLELGAQIDTSLIKKKMRIYKEHFKMEALIRKIKSFSKEEFIKDLRPFIPINERAKLGNFYDYTIEYLTQKITKITG